MHGDDLTDDSGSSFEGDSSSDDALLQAVAAAPPKAPPDASGLLASATVVEETFRIDGVLGRGAMGVVYLATDLALDRRVALKLHASADDTAQTSRMWREAKAMARLAHPNVITVHEVGLHAGRVYIAMELVEGGTVQQWLKQPRPWRDVVEVFVQAARGLAAAHRVGIVHRDFKPSNMLIDGEGRVRVADFGLARVAGDLPELENATSSEAISMTSSPAAKTRTGVAVGTPAYMAPEQFGGAAIDPRCDQFAFCVALYEGLYGVRPHDGETLMELRAAAAAGRVRAAVEGRRVPGWLRSILLRGLQPQPADRFADMDALVSALRADPTRRRRIGLGAIGVCVLAGAALIGREAAREAQRARCASEADAIDEIWNDDVKSQLHEALLGTGVSYSESTFAHGVPVVDGYVEQWRETYSWLCAAAEVAGSDSANHWPVARRCLGDRRVELDALLSVLTDEPSVASVEETVAGLSSVERIEPCTDDAWLALQPGPEHEPSQALREAYWHARALRVAGRHDEGRAETAQLLDELDRSDVELHARALMLSAGLAEDAGEYAEAEWLYRTAFEVAFSSAADLLALEAASELVEIGRLQARYETARMWATAALSLLRRVDGEERLEGATLHVAIGYLDFEQGRYADAEGELRRTVEILDAVVGPRHPYAFITRDALGKTLDQLGRGEEALTYARQQLEFKQQVWGPDHPNVAGAHASLADAYASRIRWVEAERETLLGLAILEPAFGPDHIRIGQAMNTLAIAHGQLGRHDEAEQEFERALAIAERTLGASHHRVGQAHVNLGSQYYRMERYADALRELLTGAGTLERSAGPEHPSTVGAHAKLGDVFLAQWRYAEAEREFAGVLAVRERTLPAGHPDIGMAHYDLGRVHEALGRPVPAEHEYVVAVEIWDAALPPEHPDLATGHVRLGNLYVAMHRFQDAERQHDLGLDLRRKALGANHPDVARALIGRAEARIGLGNAGAAVSDAQQGTEIFERSKVPPSELAHARVVLARAAAGKQKDPR